MNYDVTSNFHFGVKVGMPNYSSKDGGGSISVTQTVEGDEGTALEAGESLMVMLSQMVKTIVANEMGIELLVDENGVLQPAMGAPVEKSNVTALPTRTIDSSAAAPSASVDDGGNVMFDGRPVKMIYDNRPRKQRGEGSPRQPDFNVVWGDVVEGADPKIARTGYWLTSPRGEPNKNAQAVRDLYEAHFARQGDDY